MCERMRWAGALALCAMAIATAAGQNVPRYQRQVDSLTLAWRSAQSALEMDLEQQRLTLALRDTLVDGPIHVMVSPRRRALAQRAVSGARLSLSHWYGTSLATLDSHTFAVRDVTPSDGDGVDSTYVIVSEIVAGTQAYRQVVLPDSALVTTSLRTAMLRALARSLDAPLRQWLSATDLPVDTLRVRDWTNARLQLLSSGAAVGRRCYNGDVRACRLALLLDESTDPFVDLYDSGQRRSMVERMEENGWRRGRGRSPSGCLAGDDQECIAALRGLGTMPHPIRSTHRTELVQVAMAIGGAGAMQRLLTTTGGVDARLQAAAGVPTDSIVRAWVTRIRSGRKPSDDMSPAIAGLSLVWTLVFGAMALRSSRWR